MGNYQKDGKITKIRRPTKFRAHWHSLDKRRTNLVIQQTSNNKIYYLSLKFMVREKEIVHTKCIKS